MSEPDNIYSALKPSLRGISARTFRSTLKGLEATLETRTRRRTQLTIRRLRFRGEKNGDFRFQPGVNVLRAGNDKGKSSILKLIHFCLTGKNELKKDVNSWIAEVELVFELDGVAHAIVVDKTRRPRGRLVRLGEGFEGHGAEGGVSKGGVSKGGVSKAVSPAPPRSARSTAKGAPRRGSGTCCSSSRTPNRCSASSRSSSTTPSASAP